MTTEKISSPAEYQEAAEPLRASSDPEHKQCENDHDCPSGERCVNGTCQAG
jgi:hypothetical protein